MGLPLLVAARLESAETVGNDGVNLLGADIDGGRDRRTAAGDWDLSTSIRINGVAR